jgi:hypothetical protein
LFNDLFFLMPGLFAAGVLLGLAAGLFAGGLGLDRGIVQAGHRIQQSALQAVRGYPALRKGEQETFTGREIEKQVTYVGKIKGDTTWPQEDVEKFGHQIIAFK